MICPGCRDDLDHCHGALVVYVDGIVECTEPGCIDLDRVRHEFVVLAEVASVTRRRRVRAA